MGELNPRDARKFILSMSSIPKVHIMLSPSCQLYSSVPVSSQAQGSDPLLTFQNLVSAAASLHWTQAFCHGAFFIFKMTGPKLPRQTLKLKDYPLLAVCLIKSPCCVCVCARGHPLLNF
jgi:hypothetical protein